MPPATVPVQCRAPIVSLGSWRHGANPEGVAFLKEKYRIAAGVQAGIQQSLALLHFSFGQSIASGFVCRTTDVIIRVDFFSGQSP